MPIEKIDRGIIYFCRQTAVPLARFGLFVVYFWFGILKVIGKSPATPLVQGLFEKTIAFMPFSVFLGIFGLFEMLIGILFVIRGLERVVIPLLLFHMVLTCMPLFLLPSETWAGFLVPTLEGQYIIKNLLLIAAAIGIAAHVPPIQTQA
jgi:uncharacterized membrane protein YkgB